MSTASERGRRKVAASMGVAAFAGAVGILVAGCSGGTGSSNTAAPGATTSTTSPVSSAGSTSASGGNGGKAQAAFQAYTGCLQQHGVKVPTFSGRPFPNGSGRAFPSGSRRPRPSGSFVRPTGTFSRPPGGFGGVGGGFGGFLGSASADPATQAALKACASLLPQGGFGRGDQAGTISATTYAAFASCMSDNGVTIAATDPQTGLRNLNRSDPKTSAALKVCQAILGRAGAAGAGGSAAPSPAPSAG